MPKPPEASLTILAAALLAGALLTIQPYTADWPGTDYAAPARRYVRAALDHDSVALRRLSSTLRPVTWALHVSRTQPGTLASWAGRIHAYTGERQGDTTEVFVYPSADACDDAPIVFRFVGSGAAARVVNANSACFSAHGP